ncbi:P4Hc [Seminavis robusta]|uniref:P4Hc n=1 Tax=Seminavis robusta TaxID=568900 RepID=A0A9N8D6F1_9STRA|nr:P4Hc [Seminavis robusta]|eukprot:Sro12_g009330.1 P4Hc (328) ;mRNA; r:90710-91693
MAVSVICLAGTTESFTSRPSASPSSASRLWETVPRSFRVPQDIATKVLSEDPLVYIIPNLLSPEECQSYQDHVLALQETGRTMTQSNPPQVSLEASKLWPLPFLSLGAGIPPLIRLWQESESSAPTLDQALAVMMPPIVIALCASVILAYGVILPLIQKLSATRSRTSQAMALNKDLPDEDMQFCRDLVQRVSHYTGHPWHAWEAPVVTRYDPGAIFARHGDASPTLGTEWSDQGGQRVVTCICYLNTLVEGGGETSFDQLGIDVPPQQGDALVFFPADPNTLRADPRTTHESLPPQQEKWIVQMFGRIGPRVPPPLGLPDSFASLL